jgi:hypothetical protein
MGDRISSSDIGLEMNCSGGNVEFANINSVYGPTNASLEELMVKGVVATPYEGIRNVSYAKLKFMFFD